ncbi:MAG: sigma-70 family RNA polymerase sigma factor [Clostridia bacterium]|nr:sigma-70 family RNA polymerase sigma factor [Clostridia bacterium]
MKKAKTYEERVQNQFGGFCARVLKNEARNIDREFNIRFKNEKSIEELTEAEFIQLAVEDNYFLSDKMFTVLDNIKIIIKDDGLAEALRMLPQNKRDIILLSYFVGLSDTELSERMNTLRQTISKRRTSTLRELRKYLLKEGYSWQEKD